MASLLPPPQFICPGEGALLPFDPPVPIPMLLASGWSLFISPETPRPLLLLYLSFSGEAKGGSLHSPSNLALGWLLLSCSVPLLKEFLYFWNILSSPLSPRIEIFWILQFSGKCHLSQEPSKLLGMLDGSQGMSYLGCLQAEQCTARRP